jgi:hypothetical protein
MEVEVVLGGAIVSLCRRGCKQADVLRRNAFHPFEPQKFASQRKTLIY